jgi:hypothetical protein
MGFWKNFGKMFDGTPELDEYLPVGVEAFHSWASEIIDMAGLPNNDSMKFALATIILEMDKSKGRVSKQEMATYLVKAAANQVAAFVFQDIKAKRIAKDAQEAAEKAEKSPTIEEYVLPPESQDEIDLDVPSLSLPMPETEEAPEVNASQQVPDGQQEPPVHSASQ